MRWHPKCWQSEHDTLFEQKNESILTDGFSWFFFSNRTKKKSGSYRKVTNYTLIMDFFKAWNRVQMKSKLQSWTHDVTLNININYIGQEIIVATWKLRPGSVDN